MTANLYKEVAKGGGNEPHTHHHTLVLGRGNLRDEGDAHRAQEKLSEGKDKVYADKPVGGNQGLFNAAAYSCLICGSIEADGCKCHEAEGHGRNQHAVCDLAGCRRLLALCRQGAENGHGDRCEGYHIERVEVLEDRGADLDAAAEAGVLPHKVCACKGNYAHTNPFSFL